MDLSKQSRRLAYGQETINEMLKWEAVRFLNDAIRTDVDVELEIRTLVFVSRIREIFVGADV